MQPDLAEILCDEVVRIVALFVGYVQADSTENELTVQDIPPHVAVIGVRCFIIIEKHVAVRDIQFADAMQLMFCLFYDLNLEYPQEKKKPPYYFEFVQKVLMELDGRKLSPKITTFVNAVMAHEGSHLSASSIDSVSDDDDEA